MHRSRRRWSGIASLKIMIMVAHHIDKVRNISPGNATTEAGTAWSVASAEVAARHVTSRKSTLESVAVWIGLLMVATAGRSSYGDLLTQSSRRWEVQSATSP
jgi:hypothetical protein